MNACVQYIKVQALVLKHLDQPMPIDTNQVSLLAALGCQSTFPQADNQIFPN